MPETAGGRRAGQSELRLPRRAGKSQPADRPHNSAHGREIPCALIGEAGRSRCLSGRRTGRHRPPGGQRPHRCRLHPRPGHPGDEPARHHVLASPRSPARPPTTSTGSFSASASIPRQPSAPIWRRRKPATGSSSPPAPTSAPTIQPRAPPISPTSARCSALPRGMSTGLPTAPTWRRRSCATTPRASAASSSIRFYRRPTPFPETGRTHAPASTISSRPARRKRPATPPIRISKQPSPDWSTNSRPRR